MKWLRFSNANTQQGADLKICCDNFGLHQLVHGPTRNEYLLDLYLTDIARTKVTIRASVADHKMIIAEITVPSITSVNIARHSFRLAKADWRSLEKALETADWAPLRRGCSDDAATYFMEVLWFLLCTQIPHGEIKCKKKSHPWINEECEESIALKNAAEDTVEYEQRRSECHQVLSAHHKKYLSELKAKIAGLKKQARFSGD